MQKVRKVTSSALSRLEVLGRAICGDYVTAKLIRYGIAVDLRLCRRDGYAHVPLEAEEHAPV